MGYENLISYDETDEGNNITIVGDKVSWNDLDRDETSHVSISKGVNHFSGDFEHLFECQVSDTEVLPDGDPLFGFWMLANAQSDIKALIDAGADAAMLFYYNGRFYLRVLEDGGTTDDTTANGIPIASTTYYITLCRNDSGGANTTGQYIAYVRTGSHAGVLIDTLTVDCAVGEQNDFEYVFAMMSYDDNTDSQLSDGFTQNLNLQESVIPPAVLATDILGGVWDW